MLDFDHVAIATNGVRPLLRFLTGTLGGVVLSGGSPPGAGFRALQVRIGRANAGMTVELLERWDVEHNDFLARFLDHTGAGPHHFTFKTKDIVGELARLEEAGLEPVGVNFDNPAWQELFLHPRQGHGPVIQIAESGFPTVPMAVAIEKALAGEVSQWGEPWWNEADAVVGTAAALLERVIIATDDVEGGAAFYRDVLNASVTEAPGGLALRWSGGEIVLEAADVDRPRVDRLEVSNGLWDEKLIEGTRFVPV
ncbi:MAG: VOC family protein [Acidimicrobiia bacterium]|nr:VOC family protein [Acidimicrobiia bacterium]